MKKLIFLILAFALIAISLAGDIGKAPEKQSAAPKVRFEERKPFIVMGLQTEDALAQGDYVEIWKKFFELQGNIPELVDKAFYGVYFPGKEFDPKTWQGSNYLVGMEVKHAEKIPDGMEIHKLDGGIFAVFDHIGSVDEIGNTYGYIFGKWMADSGYVPRGFEMFERYAERYKEDSPESVIEIWLPVRKIEK